MANIKITDLDAYTNPDSTDVLPIVDVDADTTKRVTIADLMENAGAGTAALPGIAFDGDPNTGIYRPAADQIALSTAGVQRLLIDDSGDVTIPGGLEVQGTTTFINTTNLQVEDKNIELGKVGTPSDTTADGGGITLLGTTNHTIAWSNSGDSWDFSEHVNIASGKEFKINGTSVLSSTTLGSGVTGSSLTSVGTITTGVWNGTPLTADSIGTGAITTAKIADDAVNADKLANTTVTAGSYTAADITVDAQGRITAAANGTLGTAEIADSAVTTAKIADDAVTAAKLADTAVTAGSYTAANITVDAQGRITSAANGTVAVSFPIDGGDNDKIRLGASQDLEIYHDGSDSYIDETGTGSLILKAAPNVTFNSAAVNINNAANTENMARFIENGAAELYHDNSKKLETTSTGINVTGSVEADSANITGTTTTNRLVVDDDGSSSPNAVFKADDQSPWAVSIKNDTYSTTESHGLVFYQQDAGDVYIRNAGNGAWENTWFQHHDGANTRNMIRLDADGSVDLYYQNAKKLETTSSGIDVTGSVTCDGLTVDGGITTLNGGAYGQLVIKDNGHSGVSSQASLTLQDSGANNLSRFGQLSTGNNDCYIDASPSGATIRFQTEGSTRAQITSGGFQPAVTNAYDLGTSSYQWRDGYFDGTVNCDGISNLGSASFRNDGSGIQTVGDFYNGTSGGHAKLTIRTYANGSGDPYIWFDAGGSNMVVGNYYQGGTNNLLRLGAGDSVSSVSGMEINGSGHCLPTANNSYDLGSSSKRWRNVYTNDLNLSNEGGTNDVDGTWGNYTIQEGEDDLFLINRRNGKKYKFNLTEVS